MAAAPTLAQYRALEERNLSLRLTLRRRDEELGQTRELVEQLRIQNERLQVRITDLEMRVRRDSTTSSQPPSSDKPWDKEARRKEHNKRKGEKKNKGGAKKGHKGHRRQMIQEPDAVERFEPQHCEACDASLEDAARRPAGRRQVTELVPLSPQVTEYRRYSKRCPDCGHRSYASYPEEVRRWGGFGPRLRALMSLLRGAYGLSLRKVSQLLKEVFGVSVSHGALSQNEQRMSEMLKPAYESVDRWLNRGPRLYVDETTWFEGHKLVWLWLKSDGRARYFRIQARRNSEAAAGFLGDFQGLLTTDDLGSYNVHDETKRQLCNGHLHRRIVGMTQVEEMSEWAKSVDEAYQAMFRGWHRVRDGTVPWRLRREHMGELTKRLQTLFEAGLAHDKKKVRGVCRRMLKRLKMWFRFVVLGSEPTNNEAERSLRPAVIQRKLTQGSRSPRGSRFMERMLTVVGTLRGYKEDVFDFFCRTVERSLAGKTLPLLPLGE